MTVNGLMDALGKAAYLIQQQNQKPREKFRRQNYKKHVRIKSIYPFPKLERLILKQFVKRALRGPSGLRWIGLAGTWNYRMVWVRRDLKDHSAPIPPLRTSLVLPEK